MEIRICDHRLNILGRVAKSRNYDIYSHPLLDSLCAIVTEAEKESRPLTERETYDFLWLARFILDDVVEGKCLGE